MEILNKEKIILSLSKNLIKGRRQVEMKKRKNEQNKVKDIYGILTIEKITYF